MGEGGGKRDFRRRFSLLNFRREFVGQKRVGDFPHSALLEK
jgi:hypothetical protein